MRIRFLDYLSCFNCSGSFNIHSFAEKKDGSVSEGLLSCSCGWYYPIIDCIPRFIPNTLKNHPEFVTKYQDKLMSFAKAEKVPKEDDFNKTFGNTQKSFGKQWLTYNVQDVEEDRATFMAKTGIEPATLSGKLVLDAGCGGGRYTYIAAHAGAEVIAVDLSESVKKTKQITQGLENVHIMQGNLMELPLKREIFDFEYSTGVLHHTPDTRQTFYHLVPFLKPGGTMAIWVYRKRNPIFEILNSSLRAITTRLPHSLLHYLCLTAIPLGLVKHWSLRRKSTAWLSKLIPPMSSHPNKAIRVCDTFDWYSPKYQWHHKVDEVKGWFQEAGFDEIQDLSLQKDLQSFHKSKGIIIDGIILSGTKR